jgi:hypothetical protein
MTEESKAMPRPDETLAASEAAAAEAPETTSQVSIEDIARANGWKPEEEWKGDPPRDGFKSAAEFVQDGFKIQQTQHDKIDRLQEQLSGINKRMEEMSAGEAKRLHKALESQKERLLAERQEAVEVGDTAKFTQVDEELRRTEQELNEVAPQTTQDPFVAGEQEFKQKNEWFEKDRAMTAFAFSIAGGLRNAYPDITPDEYYAEIESAVKEQFPNKFVNPRRADGATVEGSSPKPNTKSKGFNSLPAEAKEAYNEIAMYNKKLTKEAYAKSFFEMEK